MVLAGIEDPRIAVASMTCALGITFLGESLGGSLLADYARTLVWLDPDPAHWCWLAPVPPVACCRLDLHPRYHLVRQVKLACLCT